MSVKKSGAFFSKKWTASDIIKKRPRSKQRLTVIAEKTGEILYAGGGVGLRFQIFEADLETSRFDECLAKQTNFKPPWMKSFLIPDVRNKWCSIPYPSGDYLKAVPSSLRKWMNPDCECCLGSLAVTLFASINLIKEIVFDEVSTKTWCHIYKTFIKILEDGGRVGKISLKSCISFKIRSKRVEIIKSTSVDQR